MISEIMAGAKEKMEKALEATKDDFASVRTEERRKEYVKLTRDKAEHGRVSVRSIRRGAKDALEAVKKDGGAGEDEVDRAEKELEALAKTHTDRIDEALKNKEAELLEV